MTVTWEGVKSRISSVLPKNSFSLWIEPITLLEEKEGEFILGCPNKFSRNWVMENYLELIRKDLNEIGAGHLDVLFKIHAPKKKAPLSDPSPAPAQLPLPNIPANRGPCKLGFNRDFTFDRFIVGRSNEFAFSASKALAQGSHWDYHTLLLLANTGLGKTHLSQAVANAIHESAPQSRVYYVTAEQFTNEMIYSLKNNCIEAFKEKYRRCCDVLLLDEIHFLSGKNKTQVELGYTLDALTDMKRKIIFTSALAPKDMPRMSKELSSRLASGLVTTIERPDFDTRVKILEKKASEHKMVLSTEIIHLLASRLKRDVRQLESALNYLKAKSELLKARINLGLAKDVLNCLVSDDSPISTEDVKKLICQYYKMDPDMLRSKSRKKVYAYPRNIYVYLCRRYTDETLEKIAKTVDRSHSTILYASELVESRIKTDSKMRRQVDFLRERLEHMKT